MISPGYAQHSQPTGGDMTAVTSRTMEAEGPGATSWEEHYREFVNPALLTALLREAVPVLENVGWSVVDTGEGYARTILPLNRESTNQHGTHQAALIALAADYTGGIALGTLLNGVPVLGVHPQTNEDGAALWLVGIRITYRRPSVGDLIASATIPGDELARIRQKYAGGDQAIIPLEICLESEGEQVGTATMSYYLRQSKALKPQSPTDRPSALYKHRVKASARLIAGLRASENGKMNRRYEDRYAELAAGPHGRLLAERFTAILPPLREMVVARTCHIDGLLSNAVNRGLKQLVLVGAGLDFRTLRAPRGSGLRVFELDLPDMLAERARVLAGFGNMPAPQSTPIALNLEFDDIGTVLRTAGFDPTAPSMFVFEGMSMYFEERINRSILSSIRALMEHPDSRLWCDIVASSVIRNATGHIEVEKFIKGMAKLGEPFVFGLDDPVPFLERLGYEIVGHDRSSSDPATRDNPLFDLYRFYVLRGRAKPEHQYWAARGQAA
jgi:methyltransferase (TIGR00027 family)